MIAGATSRRIRVSVVEFEGNSFYKVAEIVGAADLVWIRRRGGTTNCDSPFVGMLGGDCFSLFGGQHLRGISIYYRPKDADALCGAYEANILGDEIWRRRTYSHSDAVATGHDGSEKVS